MELEIILLNQMPEIRCLLLRNDSIRLFSGFIAVCDNSRKVSRVLPISFAFKRGFTVLTRH